jgi:transcriptional regulator with XRE-family HTH domain
MTIKFDPATSEAEENLLIDYQFLLQEVLSQKNLSMAELAEKVGLTKARISQIMGSEANPTVKTFARLFHALGERVVPKLEMQDRIKKNLAPAPSDWAPFELTTKLDYAVRAQDCEIVALIKEAKKSAAFASNDNDAPVLVMRGDKILAPEAA